MKKASLYFLLLAMLGGCNQDQDKSNIYQRDEGANGRAFVQNSNSLDTGLGRIDDTMSEQNPNLVPADNSRNNQGAEIAQARMAVRATNEFEPGAVWINGGRMKVTAYNKNGTLTSKQEKEAEKRLHSALVQALPRYEIDVHVEDHQR